MHHQLRLRLLTLIIATCLAGIPAHAAPPAPAPESPPLATTTLPTAATPTEEIRLRNVRWQALPSDIEMVFIAPDKRTWYIAKPPTDALQTGELKAHIEAQWSRPTPILRGARPALFEKSGRAWFISSDGGQLLGYDGKTWIERTSQTQPRTTGTLIRNFGSSGFIGNVPGHGRSMAVPINVDLGTTQVFVESTGFSVFDGTSWSFQLVEGGPATRNLQLIPDHTGKGLVALSLRPVKAWRFREGQWSEIKQVANVAATTLQSVALTPDGALLLQSTRGPVRIPLETAAPATGESLEKAFTRHLNKIDNIDPKVADAAAQSIADLGPQVVPLVNKILENIVDTGAEMRLRRVLNQLSQPVTGEASPAPRQDFFKLGALEFSQPITSMLSGPSGILMLSVRGSSSGNAPMGFYAVFPDGRHKVVNLSPNPPLNLQSSAPAPFVEEGGKAIWVSSGTLTLQRIDLTADPPTVSTLPDSTYRFVQAVHPDGTVYLSEMPPLGTGSTDRFRLPVMIYKPAAPNDRRVLRAESIAIPEISLALASDHSLWALRDSGLSRYDGKAWTTPWERQFTGMQLIPGQNGEILVSYGPSFAFISGNEQSTANDLTELVQSRSQAFGKAFQGSNSLALFPRTIGRTVQPEGTSGPREGGWSVAVDKESRIWVTSGRALRVLQKGRWIDAAWPEDSNVPGPSIAIPVGDGSAVYLWASRPSTSGPPSRVEPKAYLASIKNNQVDLIPAPWAEANMLFLDQERLLWVMRPNPGASGRGVAPLRPATVDRINATGIHDSFTVNTPPVLLDRSGVVWLAPSENAVSLWHKGNVVGKLAIPAAQTARFFCDQPGSVWVWTTLALHHFTADPATPTAYTLRGSFAVEDSFGNLFRAPATVAQLDDTGISPSGFLYTAFTDPRRGAFNRALHVVKLPKP